MWLATPSDVVVYATSPLELTAVADLSVVVGASQVPPSMNRTLPLVTALPPEVTAAVKVTDVPYSRGLAGFGVTDVLVAAASIVKLFEPSLMA